MANSLVVYAFLAAEDDHAPFSRLATEGVVLHTKSSTFTDPEKAGELFNDIAGLIEAEAE